MMTKEEHIRNLKDTNEKFKKYVKDNETLIAFLEIVPEDIFKRAYNIAVSQHKVLGYFDVPIRNLLEE